MALFETKGILPPSLSSGKLEGFERVQFNERFEKIFKKLISAKKDVLYNHSPIYPFAYLNVGNNKLFVNEKINIVPVIPVVQHNENEPSFSIYAPIALHYQVKEVIAKLDKISKRPVTITDLTEESANALLDIPGIGLAKEGWEKIRTSLDVIHNTKIVKELSGRNYSSLRNSINKVAKNPTLVIEPLIPGLYSDAVTVFRNWQELQGKKYFRVTIGRDLRLVLLYKDLIDFETYFSYVYYINEEPKAVSFGCRSWSKKDWGIDVTVKADVNCKGMSDFAFWHLVCSMNEKGINFINDSGYNTPGNKINKLKWFGGKEPQLIPMYDLRRKQK